MTLLEIVNQQTALRSSSSSDPDTSYAKATAKFDFSRDPEDRKAPTYMCRLFGQIVVVEIEVDRDGDSNLG